MIKFRKEIKRTTLKEFPLSAGSTVIQFTEDENGKTLTELMGEFYKTENVKDMAKNAKVLDLNYLFNIEIHSTPEKEDSQELRVAFDTFDQESEKKRTELLTDTMEIARAKNRKAILNLHMVGLFDASVYSQDFNFCNVDMSEMTQEDIEKKLVFIAGMSQRMNPTTYVIPTELANYLEDPENKETSLYRIFESKIKTGAVFAKGDELTNENVRAY